MRKPNERGGRSGQQTSCPYPRHDVEEEQCDLPEVVIEDPEQNLPEVMRSGATGPRCTKRTTRERGPHDCDTAVEMNRDNKLTALLDKTAHTGDMVQKLHGGRTPVDIKYPELELPEVVAEEPELEPLQVGT